jgi:hypothetical protein
MAHPKAGTLRGFDMPRHGGHLIEARRLFPAAPESFIDLSTGINPLPYPIAAIEPPQLRLSPRLASLRHTWKQR